MSERREERPSSAAVFAHASEAEMARILDFYDVRWEYEPHTFPILWNLDGDVIESFAPDFWLPDLGLYLEMTTLKQRLVRRKNRKLRKVRELYPDLRVKLFYARDFRALMLKYGKLALAAGLSGSLGQVPPIRSTAILPDLESIDTPIAGAPATEAGTDGSPAAASASVRAGADRRTARRRRARRRSVTRAAAGPGTAEPAR
jgi:hypothetical protein